MATAPLVAKEHVGAPFPWTSVATAAVRLVGLATGDDCVADSRLYATTVSVEQDTGSSGQVVPSQMDRALRRYVVRYNASIAG